MLLFFFFTLTAGPRRQFGIKLGDTRVYEPQTRARLVNVLIRFGLICGTPNLARAFFEEKGLQFALVLLLFLLLPLILLHPVLR